MPSVVIKITGLRKILLRIATPRSSFDSIFFLTVPLVACPSARGCDAALRFPISIIVNAIGFKMTKLIGAIK